MIDPCAKSITERALPGEITEPQAELNHYSMFASEQNCFGQINLKRFLKRPVISLAFDFLATLNHLHIAFHGVLAHPGSFGL